MGRGGMWDFSPPPSGQDPGDPSVGAAVSGRASGPRPPGRVRVRGTVTGRRVDRIDWSVSSPQRSSTWWSSPGLWTSSPWTPLSSVEARAGSWGTGGAAGEWG